MLLPRVLAARPHARIVTVATTGCVISEVNLRNYNWDVCSSTHVFFFGKSQLNSCYRTARPTTLGRLALAQKQPTSSLAHFSPLISNTKELNALLCSLGVRIAANPPQ